MGPMFYLVQSKEARCLIPMVLLADWPHELQPWPCAGGAGDGDKHRGSGLGTESSVNIRVRQPCEQGPPLFRNAASTYNGYISPFRGAGSVYIKYLAS